MDSLYRHGVKGQKWGVRRFQNKDGTLLTRDDPTYDNKKYVSINQEDHDKWDDYIGGAYVKKNPVIVLNPDSNLSRNADPVYTQAVQDFLKRYYGN